MLLSMAIIMEGYDVVLLSSFYALPQFNKKYGVLSADGTYTVPASWRSALSNGALCGEIIGLFVNGIVSERYGYKKTMIMSLAMMIAFIFIPFFAPNVQTLLVGEILCGIPWGVFQTLTTAYASEVCPVALRAYLCTYVNLCWVFGQLIASGVLRSVLNRTDEWAYRLRTCTRINSFICLANGIDRSNGSGPSLFSSAASSPLNPRGGSSAKTGTQTRTLLYSA